MHRKYKNRLYQSIYRLKGQEIRALLCLDFILLPLALYTSVLLRLGGNWDHNLNKYIWIFIALPIWTIPIFIYSGLYRAVTKYFDEKMVLIILIGVSCSVLILSYLILFLKISAFPKTSIIIFWTIALAYIGGTRLILRGITRNLQTKNSSNIVIYGAGSAGAQICQALQSGNEYNTIAFFDDDKNKWGMTIRGIPIYNPLELHKIVNDNNVSKVLLAMPSISRSRRHEIIQLLETLSLEIKTLPSLASLVSGEVTVNDIKEVDIYDLLGRATISADTKLLQKNIFNQTILITGAGGSIGSELTRQVANLQPRVLIMLDQSEFALYSIEHEISINYPNVSKLAILGSVTDSRLIESVLKLYKVNVIYHAAAYKHVPIVELNPIVGIKNNVIGTLILAQMSQKYNVDSMVLISTDKAVRPTNIMGASKRLSEMILQAFNHQSQHTIFTMVRFGNVLGSSGSVIPLFRKQIKHGGPVTVTHPKITRYFMTIPEAVQLVIQAGNMATGGEVFVLDMGLPIKITDLAIRMIHLSGFKVKNELGNGDIEIKYTGLRPGEKLYEELLIGDNPEKTEHHLIMKANEDFPAYIDLMEQLKLLEYNLEHYKLPKVIMILKYLVKEYTQTSTLNIN